MTEDAFTPNWYVLHTKSRFENVVNDGLLKTVMQDILGHFS